MKKNLLLVFWLTCSSVCAFSQITLTIEITGISNNTGNIMLQLLDENQKTITQQMKPANDKECTFIIKDLKPARYAVQYYHDENLTMEMEKNQFGKPLEGYGFSNNVIGTFGPPPFEKWIFELKEDKKLQLKITY